MNVIQTLATASTVVLLTATLPSAAKNSRHNSDREYEVTITNASAVTFTPILAVAHKTGIELFEVGPPPSDALVELAESGSQAGLIADLDLQPNRVGAVESNGALLEPGEVVVIEMAAGRRFNRLSIAGMLLPTNDSFVGLDGVALPHKRGHSLTYHALGYDAGSETNDELCVHIPGPQCGGAALSPLDSGEGYVRVSPGIQGVGDLSGDDYDWRNPVAIVTIKRVR